MAETNPTQFAADLSDTAADLVTVYYNSKKLLDEYNDTGLSAEVAALANDTDPAPNMGGLTKVDVTNMVNTVGEIITLMEAGHRTNCNKVVATVPPA
jgi:hypothetical protein